jgi:hypothetical protein
MELGRLGDNGPTRLIIRQSCLAARSTDRGRAQCWLEAYVDKSKDEQRLAAGGQGQKPLVWTESRALTVWMTADFALLQERISRVSSGHMG